jgi:hydrogenase nickel incorporation protein HypA/HybF
MHEFSLVQSLLESIDRTASEHRAAKVTRVVVRYGPLSGIVPHLLGTAFDTFKEGTIADKARLDLRAEAMRLSCRGCGKTTAVYSPRFKCPKCGSTRVESENGDALILERVEMECP